MMFGYSIIFGTFTFKPLPIFAVINPVFYSLLLEVHVEYNWLHINKIEDLINNVDFLLNLAR